MRAFRFLAGERSFTAMKIYVCVKHVPDSAATITVGEDNNIEEGITFLINPYDEHAITEASRIKITQPDVEVIAVCLAKSSGENTLRSALAMGADRGIFIITDHYPDAITTARALRAAIDRDGRPDLILTGKESIDNEGMQTMFRLAHYLNMPAATNVVAVEMQAETVQVTCEKEDGAKEILKMRLPCLLAAGKGLNTPKYPTFPDIVRSRGKKIETMALDQLDIQEAGSSVVRVELKPAEEKREPKAITGNPEEVAREIVRILKDEAKVI
jgi:electron transfer flavoprotein beta subunit